MRTPGATWWERSGTGSSYGSGPGLLDDVYTGACASGGPVTGSWNMKVLPLPG